MANVLKINDTSLSVDILYGVFTLADGGWEIEIADDPVWETFALIGKGTDAEIRAEHNRIEILKERANRYLGDMKESTPVYLTVAGEGESTKQAIVLDIQFKYNSDSNIGPLLGANAEDDDTVVLATLAVLRAPYFEGGSVYAGGGSSIDTGGGKANMISPGGTVDGRLSMFNLVANFGPLMTFTKYWIGIRRARYGTSSFDPTWEAEAGTNVIADTTDVADAACSGGNKVQIAFSTSAALAERFYIKVGDVLGSNYTHMIGEYLVLGRVKLDAGTTEVRVQLRQGWMAGRNLNEIVGDTYLSAVQDANLVNWNLVELGRFTIPGTGIRDGWLPNTGVRYYGVSVYAERLSVAGNIQIDELILIPTDGLAVLTDCAATTDGGGIYIYTSPLNEQLAVGDKVTLGTVGTSYSINFALSNWAVPVDSTSVLVVAAQEATAHTLSKNLDVNWESYARWRAFRT